MGGNQTATIPRILVCRCSCFCTSTWPSCVWRSLNYGAASARSTTITANGCHGGFLFHNPKSTPVAISPARTGD